MVQEPHPGLGQGGSLVGGRSGASPVLFWRCVDDQDAGSTARRWVHGLEGRGSHEAPGSRHGPDFEQWIIKNGPLAPSVGNPCPLCYAMSRWTDKRGWLTGTAGNARTESIRHLAAHKMCANFSFLQIPPVRQHDTWRSGAATGHLSTAEASGAASRDGSAGSAALYRM